MRNAFIYCKTKYNNMPRHTQIPYSFKAAI